MTAALVLAWAMLGAAPATDEAAPPRGEAPAAAPEPLAPPRASAALIRPGPVWVGEMLQVEVELWRDDREKKKPAPFFTEARVRGAIAMLSSWGPPPEIREQSGVDFLVQRRRYLVFPQRAGTLSIPPILVQWQPSAQAQRVGVRTGELEVDVEAPPLAGDVLVASSVTIEQTLDVELDELRVGDAFTRTVTITATGTDAVMLPALDAATPDGLVAYPGEVESHTNVNRGSYTARRSTPVTFVAQDWGWHTLPALSVTWIDPRTAEVHTATLPELTVRVRVNPSLGAGCLGPDATARGSTALVLLVLAAVGGTLAYRRRRRRRPVKPGRRSPSTRKRFADLMRAVRANQPVAALNAMYRWLTARGPDPIPTLARYEQTAAPTEAPLDDLQRRLFEHAQPQAWDGDALEQALDNANRAQRREQAPALPPLNRRRS